MKERLILHADKAPAGSMTLIIRVAKKRCYQKQDCLCYFILIFFLFLAKDNLSFNAADVGFGVSQVQ